MSSSARPRASPYGCFAPGAAVFSTVPTTIHRKDRCNTLLTIIHGADFHLDSPFSGLSPQRAAQRRGEQRQLLSALAALAREKGADLVLLAGDLLDGRQTYRETAQALARALGDIPCPVFLAPGNHDYMSPASLYATLEWPENVTVFTGGELAAVELPHLGCVVHGRGFQAPREEQDPLAGFQAPQDGKIHLMVLHGEVEGQGNYAPIARENIARSGLAYLALGHIHQCSGVQREGNTCWAYPGCPEGRGFDETGEKGVLCLEVDENGCRGELIPLGKRRYETLSVDLTNSEKPLETLLAALPRETERDVYRLTLTGEREEDLDLEGLKRALEPRFYGLTLLDRTRVRGDVWRRMEEDTLTGLFLRALEPQCRQEPDNRVLQLAVRYGLAALEKGEDVAP